MAPAKFDLKKLERLAPPGLDSRYAVHESRLTFLLIVVDIPVRFASFDNFNSFNIAWLNTFDFRSISS